MNFINKNCFFSVLTSSHLIGFEVFCKSFFETNQWASEKPIDFLMISIDLTENEIKFCESLYPKIIWIDKPVHPNNLDFSKAKIGVSAFYKICAFSIFDYDKVLSIDCSDMLFAKDISNLFEYEIDLGMVQGWTEVRKWQQFNGGLVLIGKKLRNIKTWKSILEFEVSPMYDQDILNSFFKKEITKLPTEYNFTKRLVMNPDFQISDARIIHYVGEKPWESYKDKYLYKEIEDLWIKYYDINNIYTYEKQERTPVF